MLRFTGGTTGKGKCAMYSIDNWMACRDAAFINTDLGLSDANTVAARSHRCPTARSCCSSPRFTVEGTNITLNQLDMENWRQIVESERSPIRSWCRPCCYRLLEMQRANPKDFSSLTTLIYGAAPMSPDRLGNWWSASGRSLSRLRRHRVADDDRRAGSRLRITPAMPPPCNICQSAGRPTLCVEVFHHRCGWPAVADWRNR